MIKMEAPTCFNICKPTMTFYFGKFVSLIRKWKTNTNAIKRFFFYNN